VALTICRGCYFWVDRHHRSCPNCGRVAPWVGDDVIRGLAWIASPVAVALFGGMLCAAMKDAGPVAAFADAVACLLGALGGLLLGGLLGIGVGGVTGAVRDVDEQDMLPCVALGGIAGAGLGLVIGWLVGGPVIGRAAGALVGGACGGALLGLMLGGLLFLRFEWQSDRCLRRRRVEARVELRRIARQEAELLKTRRDLDAEPDTPDWEALRAACDERLALLRRRRGEQSAIACAAELECLGNRLLPLALDPSTRSHSELVAELHSVDRTCLHIQEVLEAWECGSPGSTPEAQACRARGQHLLEAAGAIRRQLIACRLRSEGPADASLPVGLPDTGEIHRLQALTELQHLVSGPHGPTFSSSRRLAPAVPAPPGEPPEPDAAAEVAVDAMESGARLPAAAGPRG
jgi:hypothetical protein